MNLCMASLFKSSLTCSSPRVSVPCSGRAGKNHEAACFYSFNKAGIITQYRSGGTTVLSKECHSDGIFALTGACQSYLLISVSHTQLSQLLAIIFIGEKKLRFFCEERAYSFESAV